MMTRAEIADCLKILVTAYPGRFLSDEQTIPVWNRLLGDLDAKIVLSAVVHTASSCEWPPSIAQIRKAALNLSRGETSPPSPWEAWERARMNESATDIEKRCLELVGGSWAVKRSDNQEVLRSQFLKCYTELMHRADADMCAVNEIKQLAETTKPEAPMRLHGTREQQFDHTMVPGFTPASPEAVQELLRGLLTEKEAEVLRATKRDS